MNVQLLIGDDALERVNSEEFRSEWKALYACCPWATASLHPDFVAPWYRHYHALFLPVIVVEEDGNGSLTGLFTLALRRNGRRLSGAGDHQAEYQGWIQGPDAGSGFIVNAVRELRALFPRADICLRYLPPGIPLRWVEEGVCAQFCSLRSHPRPIMRIDAAAMDRQRNKKNHRQNYNRLKRVGEVQFQRVVEHDHFIRVFDDICDQYDFRQAALYRSMPFASDPAKRRFYLELHQNGLLHTTILTVGEEVAASHIGLLSQDRAVHLGINTYDPALAAHSPGNLLLAMLGVHLATEKMPVLDLTPGGDGYKEHFATEHDAVHELTIYSNTKRRMRMEALLGVIRYGKTRLRTAGYRTADVQAVVAKLKGVRLSGWRELLETLRARLNSRQCEFRHCRSPQAVTADRLPISRNRLRDVLKFDAQGSSVKFREFSDLVMKRLERSNDLYCFVYEGRLQIFCWARSCIVERTSSGSPQDARASGNSIVLFDLCVHRCLEDQELVRRFVEAIVLELEEKRPDAEVRYHGALNRELQAVVERCGFVGEPK